MGAAPAREAESIVYRRKSFRKKNSSPTFEEPRGSAVGDTTNDSIAPTLTFIPVSLITHMVQLSRPDRYSPSCLHIIRSDFQGNSSRMRSLLCGVCDRLTDKNHNLV